jgi:hypothetical protein
VSANGGSNQDMEMTVCNCDRYDDYTSEIDMKFRQAEIDAAGRQKGREPRCGPGLFFVRPAWAQSNG